MSRRFEYAEVAPDGKTKTLSYAPYLDHRPATDDEIARLGDPTRLFPRGAEQLALEAAIEHAVPEHLIEVRARVLERVRNGASMSPIATDLTGRPAGETRRAPSRSRIHNASSPNVTAWRA